MLVRVKSSCFCFCFLLSVPQCHLSIRQNVTAVVSRVASMRTCITHYLYVCDLWACIIITVTCHLVSFNAAIKTVSCVSYTVGMIYWYANIPFFITTFYLTSPCSRCLPYIHTRIYSCRVVRSSPRTHTASITLCFTIYFNYEQQQRKKKKK